VSVRARAGAGALVAVAALTLAGCGRTGVAASIGGRDISVDHVQSATASLHAADRAAFGQVTDRQVLAVLLYGPLAVRAASAAGKGISDDTVRSALANQARSNKDRTARPDRLNAAAIEALRANIAFSSLDSAAQKDIIDQVVRQRPRISPRYGSFDPATATIGAPKPNWLTPVATPTANPSATG
jgi:hypothetical protein